MLELTAGMRLKSATGTAEVVVVRPGAGDITCGGLAMLPPDANRLTVEVSSGAREELLIGKRYSDEVTGIEVLCTKAGPGGLAFDGRPMQLHAPKPLPASD